MRLDRYRADGARRARRTSERQLRYSENGRVCDRPDNEAEQYAEADSINYYKMTKLIVATALVSIS
jgi:hypothetical protein